MKRLVQCIARSRHRENVGLFPSFLHSLNALSCLPAGFLQGTKGATCALYLKEGVGTGEKTHDRKSGKSQLCHLPTYLEDLCLHLSSASYPA